VPFLVIDFSSKLCLSNLRESANKKDEFVLFWEVLAAFSFQNYIEYTMG
jgi:hypothetical protein